MADPQSGCPLVTQTLRWGGVDKGIRDANHASIHHAYTLVAVHYGPILRSAIIGLHLYHAERAY